MEYQSNTSYARFFATGSLSIILSICLYDFYPTLKNAIVNQHSITKLTAVISIICFSAYLIYKKRLKLKRANYSISPLAMIAVFALQLGYIFGIVYKLNSLDLNAVILMMPALVLLCYGSHVMEIILFPILYFLLIIPLLQIDLKYDNNLYWLAITLGYGYINYQSIFRRSILIISGVLLPIITYYVISNYVLKNTHFPYREWLPFIVSILGMGFIAYILREPRRVFISGISSLEFERSENGLLNKMRHWTAATLMVAVGISLTPWLVSCLQSSYFSKNYIQTLSFPIEQSIWEGPGVVTGDVWKPIFPDASQTHQTLYIEKDDINNSSKSIDQTRHKKNIVYLSLAYYSSNQSSILLLNDKNCFYNPKLWNSVTSENLKITLQNKKTLNLIENVVEVKGVKRLIWSWYCIRGFTIQPNSSLFSLIDLTKRVSLQSEGFAAIIISSPLSNSLEESRARLHRFLEDKYRSIEILSN